VAIQNAPGFLGRGLAAEELARLVDHYPNIRALKAEGPAAEIEWVIAAAGGRVAVPNGRRGFELVDNLRAGCAGLILAPAISDHAVAAYNHFRNGDIDAAQAAYAYARLLPAASFAMQSIEALLCYGKRIMGLRMGIEIHDRAPAQRPTSFGLECVAEQVQRLGNF
jgi:2-keto-3-deoxy-L-arabinonate dehydratase